MWSLSSVRCGYVPMHHKPMKEKNHEARLLLESMHLVGSQHRGETMHTSNARCTSQRTWECEVETKCVILTLCARLVRPAYSLTKMLTNQYSASWFVFSLYFLEAEKSLSTNCIHILLV